MTRRVRRIGSNADAITAGGGPLDGGQDART